MLYLFCRNCSISKAGWCIRKFLESMSFSQGLRNFATQVIFAECFAVRNFTVDFRRTSLFRSLQNFAGHFGRSKPISHGRFARVAKISQPSFLHSQTHFFTFPFPRPANLYGAGSHPFLFLPSNFQKKKRKKKKNWQRQT